MRSRANENVLQRLKVLPDHLLDFLLLAIVVCDLVKLPEKDVVLVGFGEGDAAVLGPLLEDGGRFNEFERGLVHAQLLLDYSDICVS